MSESHRTTIRADWATKALCIILSLAVLGIWGVVGEPRTASAADPLPAPTNLVPSGGSHGPTPKLSWSAVTGATSYQVTYPNAAGVAKTVKIWGTSYSPTDDFPAGPVSWSVAGIDSANVVGAASTATFTNTAVDGPVLTCPGAIVNVPAQAPTLTWTAVRGVKTYTLLVSSSSSFVPASTQTYKTQATSFTLTKGLPVGQPYYAKVSGATAAGINSGSSNTCTFQVAWSNGTTNIDDATPGYLSPANAASVRDVQLEWSPLKGAARYELQISPNGDWTNNLLYDIVTDSSVWSPAKTLDNGAYYWRVRGIDNQGNFSRWSDYPSTPGTAWQFTVAPLATPVPSAPTAESVVALRDLNFSWNPVPGAGAYQIELAANSSFTGTLYTCYTTHTDWSPYAALPPQVAGPVNAANTSGCATSRANLEALLTGGTIYWHVRAVDDLVRVDAPATTLFTTVNKPPKKAFVSTWSSPQRFFTNQVAPALTAPGNGAVVTVPTLTWSRVPDATYYQVQVTGVNWGWDSGTSTCTAPTSTTGTTRNYKTSALSLTPTLIATPRLASHIQCPVDVTWTVTAMSTTANPGTTNNYVVGPTPGARTFRWNGYAAGTSASPDPIAPSPAHNATVSAGAIPTFAWKPVTGADHYEVWWYDSPLISTYSVMQDLNVGNNLKNPSTESFTPNQPLPVGTGAWQVVALSAGNAVISAGPKQTITVTAPEVVPPATIMFSKKASDGSVTQCNAGCTVAATPRISWQGDPTVTHYRVYIALDPSFTNIVRIYDTQTNSIRPVEALPDNQAGQSYYVAVASANANWYTGAGATGTIYGNHGAIVDPTHIASFEKKSAGVANTRTVAPGRTGGACTNANAGTVSDVPTFCWDAAPYVSGDVGAMAYHLQVSVTPDFSTILDQVWVDQPTYTPYFWPASAAGDGGYSPGSVITPPSSQTIKDRTYPDGPLYWRVQALDSTGNALTYSTVASVTKASTGITMSAPASGATVNETPSLQWTSKVFAAQYEVQVAKNGDTNFSASNIVFGQKTDLTAITPSGNNSLTNGTSLPEGSYVWRVRSIDAGGQEGAWTSARAFTVKPAASSLTYPADNVTFTKIDGLGFTWTPVAGAVTYRIYVSTNPVATTGSYVNRTTVSTGWSFDTAPKNGKQYWVVQALDGSNAVLSESATRSFTYDGTRPTINGQKGAAMYKRALLTWNGSAATTVGAITSYTLTITDTTPNPDVVTTKTVLATQTDGAPGNGVGGGSKVCTTGNSPSCGYVLSGLTTGHAYKISITPNDANGPGTASGQVSVTPQTYSPDNSAAAAIRQQYNDLFGRNETSTEKSTWSSRLGATGSYDLVSFIDTLWQGSTFQADYPRVGRLYAVCFNRRPDAGGLLYWVGKAREGMTNRHLTSAFINGAEYRATYGGTTNREFVRRIYVNAFGRNPDTGGWNYWTDQLNRNKFSRAHFLSFAVAESAEYKVTSKNRIDASLLYIVLLRRSPTVAEQDYMEKTYLPTHTFRQAIEYIVGSVEYYNRVK